MYNVKDNAEAKLQVWLSSLATTLVVELWNWMLFPEAPFIAVLNKRDSDWKITKSEKVEVTAKDWDQFTVNRGYEWTTPLDFNAWDFFSLFVLAKHIQELQERAEYSAKDTSVANEYSNQSTYTIWSIVMYKWDRYKCTTAVSTAENFNPSKWTRIPVQSDLSTISSSLSSVTSTLNDITTNWVPTSVLKKQMIAWEAFTSWTHIWRLANNKEEDALLTYSLATTWSVYTYANSSWVASNQISFYASKSDSWTTISDLLVTVWSLTWTVSFNSIWTTRTKVTVTLNGNMNYSKWSNISIKFSLSTTTADWTFYLYMDPFNYYPTWSREIYIRANEVWIYSTSWDNMYALCDFWQSEYCQISYSASKSPTTYYSDNWTARTSWNSWAHRYWRLTRYTNSYTASNVVFKFRRYHRIMVWSNSFSTEVLFKANTWLWETVVQSDVIAGWTWSLTLWAITQIATWAFTPTLSGCYDISVPGNNFFTSFIPTTDFDRMQNHQYLEAGKTYTIYLYWLWDRVTSWWNYSYWAVSIIWRCNWLWDRPYMPIANVSSWTVGNFAIQWFVDNMPEEWWFLCGILWDRCGMIKLWEKRFFWWKEEYYEKVKAYKTYASNYATGSKRSNRIFSSADYNF